MPALQNMSLLRAYLLRVQKHQFLTARSSFLSKLVEITAGMLITRGGVEDTRLEAKAKDTKKSEAKVKDSLSEDRHSRGQGQECSRPRPRTKDTSASALQKKKVSTKIFQAISKKKKGLHKNFSSDLYKRPFSKTFFKRSTKF